MVWLSEFMFGVAAVRLACTAVMIGVRNCWAIACNELEMPAATRQSSMLRCPELPAINPT
ncbi:MAG: hypothetical protein BWY79_02220 [Actinobacteria bacterium ADurb.Bin444]|nr:MAG: hypothetical protein BWY79_02220 [Actinobacteria bacterium ADurb.Bin444]